MGVNPAQISADANFLGDLFIRSAFSKIATMIEFTEKFSATEFYNAIFDLAVEYDSIVERVGKLCEDEKPDFMVIHNGRVSHELQMLSYSGKKNYRVDDGAW